jgi:GTP cyclohydrolase FolE2
MTSRLKPAERKGNTMSYEAGKGVIAAKKGKAADAPSVTIQDPQYREGADLNYWIEVHGEEVVKECFLKERNVIIQRVGRNILEPDGSKAEEAQDAMIAQCSDLTLKRTAAPKSKGLTREQAETIIADAGYSVDSPKVQGLLEKLLAA